MNHPAELEKGIDAQLNKAIEVIQQLMKQKPAWDVKAPKYPKKF